MSILVSAFSASSAFLQFLIRNSAANLECHLIRDPTLTIAACRPKQSRRKPIRKLRFPCRASPTVVISEAKRFLIRPGHAAKRQEKGSHDCCMCCSNGRRRGAPKRRNHEWAQPRNDAQRLVRRPDHGCDARQRSVELKSTRRQRPAVQNGSNQIDEYGEKRLSGSRLADASSRRRAERALKAALVWRRWRWPAKWVGGTGQRSRPAPGATMVIHHLAIFPDARRLRDRPVLW